MMLLIKRFSALMLTIILLLAFIAPVAAEMEEQ